MPRVILALLAAALLSPSTARAQAAAPGTVVDVFLDCSAPNCDSSHIRNEIGFVNWVRDRTAADVHLLVTSQGTGSGGNQYVLAFLGLGSFAGDSVSVRLSTEQTATDAEARDRLTTRIAQGLMRYVVHTDAADVVRISMAESSDEDVARLGSTPRDDPWNAWVFTVGLDGSLDGEARETEQELSFELGASRITADWKLELEGEGDYSRNRFELSDGTFTSTTQDWNVDGFVAKTVGPLWSAGLAMRVGTSTRENQDLAVRIAPAIEYSVFPYSDFSRREITVRYSVGISRWQYAEETLYGFLEEQRWDQALQLGLDFRQPWGSAYMSLGGSHFLHDLDRYRLSVDGGIDIRLIRGLSLDVSGGYSRVHDQLYVQREGDYSDEEILLRLRALQTNYRYGTRVGLRYTFGSIYNNIVNPRLGGGRW